MSDPPPVLYLLYGDDGFEIDNFVERILARLGDPGTAMMNTTHFEGRVESGDLARATQSVPFLANRRVIILKGTIEHVRSQRDREAIKALVRDLPPTAALVVIENPIQPRHWFLKLAKEMGDAAFVRTFMRPKGGALVNWVRGYVRQQGGEIHPQAAVHLVSLIPENTRIAAMELDKLLMYTNQKRAIEIDDVELLTASVKEGDVFEMVDALGAKDGKRALEVLHRLLRDRDVLPLFGMIIRQFRLLLLYKELERSGIAQAEMANRLSVHPFVVQKLRAQAVNFDRSGLEGIFRQLLTIDEQIKTGVVDGEIALNIFITSLTSGGSLK